MMYNKSVLIVGLTGNYGMGKSTVLGMFRECGAVTLDADRIVDVLLNDESVLGKIKMVLGEGVFSTDGRLDRSRVAFAIFKDKLLRDAIEDILHPLVLERIRDFLDGLRQKNIRDKIIIIEIPLIFEKGYADSFHRIVTVYAREDIALRRLEEAGISRDDATMRLEVQMPIEEKMRRSDYTIDNSGTMDDTRAQVKDVYERLLKELED